MGQKGLREMDAEAAEEEKAVWQIVELCEDVSRPWCNVQEWDPSHVFQCRVKKATVAQAVLQEGIAQISEDREHRHTSQPYFEAVQIVSIHICRPTKEHIVHEGQYEASSNTVYMQGIC